MMLSGRASISGMYFVVTERVTEGWSNMSNIILFPERGHLIR